MVIRAWGWNLVLAVVVAVLASLVVLCVFDVIGGVPGEVQGWV
ncbi:hypothetical protein [Kribbella antibiotica]|nr:hypothetical protein [Kribbella antibiotica]